MSRATKNATRAMLHQGRYKPAIKLRVIVSNVANVKRIKKD
jgi:hypothetical protein